ncbi:MAG: type IX secretion system membrane protein PorP/SprF, partial [Bacteroidetes bacterium]|nr:type IX secretion system membrane protein PorP/SprF [Bacteroidota bacterium]
MTIAEPLPITTEIETTNASCPGVPDGAIVLNISGGTTPYTVLWSNSATTKDLTNITDGTYTVEIMDANLCTKTDSTIIGIFGENCVTEIPSIITPNGDGKNDVWRIESIHLYKNVIVEVYTRWGKFCNIGVFIRKRLIIYIGFVVLFFCSISTFGQQLPSYSQYMMNGFLLNPALAGNDGYTSINLTAREQWLGISSAPRTHALSVQTGLLKT